MDNDVILCRTHLLKNINLCINILFNMEKNYDNLPDLQDLNDYTHLNSFFELSIKDDLNKLEIFFSKKNICTKQLYKNIILIQYKIMKKLAFYFKTFESLYQSNTNESWIDLKLVDNDKKLFERITEQEINFKKITIIELLNKIMDIIIAKFNKYLSVLNQVNNNISNFEFDFLCCKKEKLDSISELNTIKKCKKELLKAAMEYKKTSNYDIIQYIKEIKRKKEVLEMIEKEKCI